VKKERQEQKMCYRKLIHSVCTVAIHDFPSCYDRRMLMHSSCLDMPHLWNIYNTSKFYNSL